jgi:hypothetical protein
MSYDLTLFRPPPGVDPLEAWRRIEREEEGFSAGTFEPKQIAGILKARVPEFKQSQSIGGEWIELDHDAQVQVLITDRDVGIGMPYFRKEVSPMMQVIGACIECLGDAGFVAFDPQFDKIVTAADFAMIQAQYRDTDKLLPQLKRDAEQRRAARKPWWKFW